MNYTGPKVRLSRRVGVALTPKAAKIMEKRPHPPGQHGGMRKSRQESDYKRQLTQKQLLRYQYNISEQQMKRYYQIASRGHGNPAEKLIQLLETRLDALILRANFAPTIYAARQYVSHGHITVNGKRVDIPSYRAQPGDVVAVREKSRELACFEGAASPVSNAPPYLERVPAAMEVHLTRLPLLDEAPIICEIQRVIEFYSR
jgi:small subunit ribosomal protein S4